MSSVNGWRLALAWVSASVFVSAAARAQPNTPAEVPPEVIVCAEHYEAAQVDAKTGKLRSAVRHAVSCAQDSCPAYVRADCLRFADEYKAQTPSIIIVARDVKGCDTTDVKVSVDGVVVLEKVDGRALEVDPGEHLVAVEVSGLPVEEQRIVATQSQKDRPVKFGEARAGNCQKGPSERPPPPPPPIEQGRSGLTVAGLVLGGLGLCALATSAGFGIAGFVERGELDDCKPCSQGRIDDVRRTFIIGDVFLANGAALVTASIVLLVVGGNQSTADPKQARLLLLPSLSGGAVGIRTTF